MIDEDDGIPVLTDVLRLGSGPVAASSSAALGQPDAANEADDASLDETLLTDQLVIGNEPEPPLESYLREPDEDPSLASQTAPTRVGELEVASDANDDAANADAFSDAAVGTHAGPPPADEVFPQEDPGPVEEHVLDEIAPSTISEGALVDASKPGALDDDAFIARLRESILDDLATRIDTEFDARLAQAMRAEIENAIGGLQVRLREHLGDALRDVVRRAVDEEIAPLRATRAD